MKCKNPFFQLTLSCFKDDTRIKLFR